MSQAGDIYDRDGSSASLELLVIENILPESISRKPHTTIKTPKTFRTVPHVVRGLIKCDYVWFFCHDILHANLGAQGYNMQLLRPWGLKEATRG